MPTARSICCRGYAAARTAALLMVVAALLAPLASMGLVVYDRLVIDICFDGKGAVYRVRGEIYMVNETYDEVYTEGSFNATRGVFEITSLMIKHGGLGFEGYMNTSIRRIGEAIHIVLRRRNESRTAPWSYTLENYTGILEPAPEGYVLYANVSLITTSKRLIGELNNTIAYLRILSRQGAGIVEYSVSAGRNHSLYIARVAVHSLPLSAATLASPLLSYYLGLPPGLGVDAASFLRDTLSLRLMEEWRGTNHRYRLVVESRNISVLTQNIYLYPRGGASYAALRVSWGYVEFVAGEWVYRAPVEAPIGGRVPGFLNASLHAIVEGRTVNERYENLVREVKKLVMELPATVRIEACTGWLLYRGIRATHISVSRDNASVLDDTEYVYRGGGGIGVSLLVVLLATAAVAGVAAAAYFLRPSRLCRGSE